MRQLIGLPVQFPITQTLLFIQHGRRFRPPPRLLRYQLMHALSLPPVLHLGAVPLHQHLPPLPFTQQLQLPYPRLRIPAHLLQHVAVMLHQPLHLHRFKHILPVFHTPLQPPCSIAPRFSHRHRQIELRRSRPQRSYFHFQPRQFQPLFHRVLQRKHHLKQWTPAQLPLRLQLLHQLFKRHLLVPVPLHRSLPHSLQHLLHPRLSPYLSAQHQRVYEKSDQPLHFARLPPRHRRPHREIPLPAVTHQQNFKSRQQRHELRRSHPRSQLLQLFTQSPFQPELLHPAPRIALSCPLPALPQL